MADTAKLFKNGRSQAVRLPKEYRFEGDEVKIYKSGNRVILEPIENEGPERLWQQFQRDAIRPPIAGRVDALCVRHKYCKLLDAGE